MSLEVVYFGSKDNFVYALKTNGTEPKPSVVWHYNARGDVYGKPALGEDGMVYVGSKSHYVYCIVPDPLPPVYTTVSFDTTVTLNNITAEEFDDIATEAFVEVTANGVTGVDAEDIVITSISTTTSALRTNTKGVHTLTAPIRSTEITFTTNVVLEEMEDTYYDDASVMLNDMETELTNLYNDPTTSQIFVNTAVADGSTTITSNTVLFFGTTAVDTENAVVNVMTTAPTSAPGTSSSDSASETDDVLLSVTLPIAAVVVGLTMAGVYVYLQRQVKMDDTVALNKKGMESDSNL
jgi:hypothetical protein